MSPENLSDLHPVYKMVDTGKTDQVLTPRVDRQEVNYQHLRLTVNRLRFSFLVVTVLVIDVLIPFI